MPVWRWLAAAVVWLSAVTVVAAVAWFAIESAGREVAGVDHAVSLVAAVQPSPGPATSAGNVGPTPRASSTTLGLVRPDDGSDPGAPSGPPSVPGSGAGRTETYSSAGGVVGVRCVGGTVPLWGTRVLDGWRVDATPKAGGHLRVIFVAGDGRVAGVEAVCQNGQPSFTPVR